MNKKTNRKIKILSRQHIPYSDVAHGAWLKGNPVGKLNQELPHARSVFVHKNQIFPFPLEYHHPCPGLSLVPSNG